MSAVRQIGIEQARGRFVAQLDDDFWYSEQLEARLSLVRSLSIEGGLRVVSCGVDVVTPVDEDRDLSLRGSQRPEVRIGAVAETHLGYHLPPRGRPKRERRRHG